MICQNNDYSTLPELVSRRQLFTRAAAGLTGVALASLLDRESPAAGLPSRAPHFAPRATSVIQLFQHGGPSHMDLFDPKPELNRRDGQKMPAHFKDLVAISKHGGLLGTPYKFKPAGECGVQYSEILPHTAKCADDIAVIRSMFTEHNNHEQALWMLHGGRTITGRPTWGSWVNYALGSENDNLPAYVVLRNDSKLPVDGIRNWTCGFLPPRYQGVHFRHNGPPVRHLKPNTAMDPRVTSLRNDLLKRLNQEHLVRHAGITGELEARIASYELAARMQTTAADALELSHETKQTREKYGLNNPKTASYGRRCLMARRLVERGVRVVQIFIRGQMWDTHADNAVKTKTCCEETDLPTAALLTDLKERGLLDSTLDTFK